jgi:predicted dinucleotide-binding enzyme
MNIAFIGYGNVGAPLADHLQRLGHTVTLAASGEPSETLRKALARNPALLTAPPKEAVEAADVVFLATPFTANAAALGAVAAELNGKILVDCTNPVGPGLTHGLGNEQSGSEFVQKQAPGARVVKAFTIYGFENFENSAYPGYGVRPAMLLCGDDADAKRAVSKLASELGWEPVDTGGIVQALHLEHMTLLWIRMVRIHGASANTVWAALRR